MSGAPPGSRVRITRRRLAPRFGVLLNYRESEPGRYTVRLDTAPGASAAPAAAVELDSAMFDRAGIRCDVLHPPLGKVVEVRFDGEQVWVRGRVVSHLLPEPTVKIALDDEVCTEVNSGFLKYIEAEWRFVVDQDGNVDAARANEDVAASGQKKGKTKREMETEADKAELDKLRARKAASAVGEDGTPKKGKGKQRRRLKVTKTSTKNGVNFKETVYLTDPAEIERIIAENQKKKAQAAAARGGGGGDEGSTSAAGNKLKIAIKVQS